MRLMDGRILRSHHQRDAYSQAECYREGRFVAPSERRALALYQRAAEEGDARAYFRLGQHEQAHSRWNAAFNMFLQAGLRSNNEVIDWLEALVSQNNGEAALVLGKIEQYRRHYDKSVELYKKAHELKHPDAMFYLGKMYPKLTSAQTEGVDVTDRYRDSARLGSKHALNELLILSATQGKASLRLGHMYESGEVVYKNLLKAIEFYEKSSEQNCADATYYLAELYSTGKDELAVDISKASRYYLLASQQGHPLAIPTWQDLAQYGPAEAQYRLGYDYYRTLSLERRNSSTQYDISNAVTWCVKAEIQGHLSAAEYLNGTFTVDIYWKIANEYANSTINIVRCQQKSVEFATKASILGCKQASLYLGKIFYSGSEGIEQNVIQSFQYLITATKQGDSSALSLLKSYAESGDKEAQFILAQYHRACRQEEAALCWFVKAAVAGHMQAKQNLKESFSADQHWMIADLYLENGVTRQDPRWYYHCKNAADNGQAQASLYLAQEFEGIDVSHHRLRMITRYATAAKLDNGEAQAASGRLAHELIDMSRNSETIFSSSKATKAGCQPLSLSSIQKKMHRK